GHGPYSHTHSSECFLERVELGEERGLDAVSCLVAGPDTVAKGLDDVIGRHTDVSGARLDHLQHRVQHTDDGAEGPILAFVEAAKAVEVAKQLGCGVHDMNDHALVTSRAAAGAREAACARVRCACAIRASVGTKTYQALPAKCERGRTKSIYRRIFFLALLRLEPRTPGHPCCRPRRPGFT